MAPPDQATVRKLIQQSLLRLCLENVEYGSKLEVDGIICISTEDEQKQIVVKVHETLFSGTDHLQHLKTYPAQPPYHQEKYSSFPSSRWESEEEGVMKQVPAPRSAPSRKRKRAAAPPPSEIDTDAHDNDNDDLQEIPFPEPVLKKEICDSYGDVSPEPPGLDMDTMEDEETAGSSLSQEEAPPSFNLNSETEIEGNLNHMLSEAYVRSASKSGRRKRGEYEKYTIDQKLEMAKYAEGYGVMRAVRYFTQKFGKSVSESTLRTFRDKYRHELEVKATIGDASPVSSLPEKPRGRPVLLGKYDSEVMNYLLALKRAGGIVNPSIAVSTARGVLLAKDKTLLAEFGGQIDLTKHWAASILNRLNFEKGKAKGMPPVKRQVENFESIKKSFLSKIQTGIRDGEIPNELVMNWGRMAVQIVPDSCWSMELEGNTTVEVDLEDKREITATFCGTLSGEFLPVQLIYPGRTEKCHPKLSNIPDDWDIWHSDSKGSLGLVMRRYIHKIIVPYVKQKREDLGLAPDHQALAIFDIYKSPCEDDLLELLEEHNIIPVFIPPRCLDQLHPLGQSALDCIQDVQKNLFQQWYAEQVRSQVAKGKSVNDVHIDLRLSVLKPLLSSWLVSAYDSVRENHEVVVSGFERAGIDFLPQEQDVKPVDLDGLNQEASSQNPSTDALNEEDSDSADGT